MQFIVVAFKSRCVDGKDNGRSEDINSDFTGTEYCACDARCDVVVGIASAAGVVGIVVGVGGVMVATSTRAAVPRLHSSLSLVVLIVMVEMLVPFAIYIFIYTRYDV